MAELTPRAQDYLRTIYQLSSKGSKVRLVTLSEALGVRMPTALQMVRSLAGQGLVKYEKHGEIELTEEGKRIAEEIQTKHNLLFEFLTKYLGVDPRVAEKDACGMEHHLSEETYDRLLKFIEFMEGCPHGLPRWLEGFHFYLRWGRRPVLRADEEAVILPMRRLSDLEPGEAGKVVAVRAGPDERLRLAERGIVIGSTVLMEEKTGKRVSVRLIEGRIDLSIEEASLVSVI
ncbi:MAG: metal-dependent transcriptional regulator [Candidatus Korarchaeota archaeon]|nr:metal-dependent transcriptional regulator [Candidatus Korarchaeota archaeon]